MYLKAVSFKGSRGFSKKKKLSTKYVRPNKLLERVGAVAYKLDLPPKLDVFHKKIHVSQFRKCISKRDDPMEDVPVELEENLMMKAKPVRIVDRTKKGTQRKIVKMVRVVWNCGEK